MTLSNDVGERWKTVVRKLRERLGTLKNAYKGTVFARIGTGFYFGQKATQKSLGEATYIKVRMIVLSRPSCNTNDSFLIQIFD